MGTDNDVYRESDDFVPDKTAMVGLVDTTGTGGDLAAQVAQMSPGPEQTRRDALKVASEQLANGERPDNIVFPGDDDIDHDQAVDQIHQSAKALDDKVEDDGAYKSPAQREAELDGSPVNPNSREALDDDTVAVEEDGNDFEVKDPSPLAFRGADDDKQAYPLGDGDGSADQTEQHEQNQADSGLQGFGGDDATGVSSEQTDSATTTVTPRPDDNASKKLWVDYAVNEKGANREDLEKSEFTKAKIIEQYGR